jgi:hypothetical protein
MYNVKLLQIQTEITSNAKKAYLASFAKLSRLQRKLKLIYNT